jgi:hypothetical protein
LDKAIQTYRASSPENAAITNLTQGHWPVSSTRLSILLLCDDWPGHANTVLDHINALRRLSRHKVRTFNPTGMTKSIALDLNEFDVIVIHYSLVLSSGGYLSTDFREKLKRFPRLKVQFIQDEYRWVDRATSASRDAGIGVLFTAALEPAAGQLYDDRLPKVRRVPTLTGYVPENLQTIPTKPLKDRKIDVAYRGRELPFWLGRLTQEKAWIGEGFLERAAQYGLRCDIGWHEEDRIYGPRWIDFIGSARATLGTESGASIADFDGSVEEAVRAYSRLHPEATYGTVHDAVLRPYEGNVVVNVISPRVFEAVSLGTALVMFPGDYSGIVTPGEHYISLEKDFSNMDQVVDQLRDDDYLEALTARAREHVVGSGRWSYRAFVKEFDRVIVEEAEAVRGPSPAPRLRLARIERTVRLLSLKVRFLRWILALLSAATGLDISRRAGKDPGSLIDKAVLAVRAALGDRDLRPLFREGRRAGLPTDSLLEEILELSLLRLAASGGLSTSEAFTLTSEFDATSRSLRFVSRPVGLGPPRVNGSLKSALDALHSRTLDVIEWDHQALGGLVRLQRPRVDVVIGSEGLVSFVLLAQIGRRNPDALRRALAPIIRDESDESKEGGVD